MCINKINDVQRIKKSQKKVLPTNPIFFTTMQAETNNLFFALINYINSVHCAQCCYNVPGMA